MSDYQTDDRLAAIEKRLNKATPGPWFQGREHERYELETDVFNEREMSATSTDVASCQEIVDATFVAHAPEDVAWLVSEVRRYRDEQNPNQAAKYWRTILTQRQMIKNQAATIERHDAKAAATEQMIDAWKDRASNYTAEVELAVGLFGQGIRDILRGES